MKPKNSTIRYKNKKKPAPTENAENVDNGSGLSKEAQDQFEVELYWCIQQLETFMSSRKLQEKQLNEINKHITNLKSHTAPLIKKRQIMRNTLGDYREKMLADEKKFCKASSTIKFLSPSESFKKSIFLKKAVKCPLERKQNLVGDGAIQNSFKFNFHNNE